MTSFAKGDRIVDPDDPTKVAVVIDGPVLVAGTPFFLVLTASQDEAMLPASELRKKSIDRTSPVSWLVDRPLVDADSLSRALTQRKLTSSLTDLVYSFSSARTLFRPHQFKPVLKVIESPVHRLLLADEVGLGKTIEAGLIWTELDARSPMRRILIVTPPGLVGKWQIEMERRFDREVRALSARDLLAFIEVYNDRGHSARIAGIVSYPQLRNPTVMEALTDRPPTFDLAIFDEAHILRNPSTRTHQAASLVAQNTEGLIFLSATPVNLGADDLFNLLHLLRPDEFTHRASFAAQISPNIHVNHALRLLSAVFPPDTAAVLDVLRQVEATPQRRAYEQNPLYTNLLDRLKSRVSLGRDEVVELQADVARLNSLAHVYTRTRKRDLRDQQAVRRPHHVQVRLTTAESDLYSATLTLVAELRRRASGAAPGLAAVMPARQASSCLPVMREYVAGLASRSALILDRLEGEEGDEDEDIVDGARVEVNDSPHALITEVELLWRHLDDADSKLDALTAALDDYNEQAGRRVQVLLFSFFRLTLDYLDRKLSDLGYRCAQMHGGIPIRDREQLLRRFRADEIDILLCSEVGSEGLDFEFCNVLVNYDLPWNPMKLEQRIGRLDRFGQQHEVIHIINFEIEGTIDTEIFLRLYRRIGIFEQSIGELEPILGASSRELTRALLSLTLTTDEQRALANRLAAAIEIEQQHLNQFADAQDQLVGADAYVDDALDTAGKANRYLTPFELARFVGGFLREAAHPARLTPLDAAGMFLLHGSAALADRLRHHGAGNLTPNFTELITTLETGTPIEVTFDSEHAYGTSATFLSHLHPLLRTVAAYHADGDNPLHPGGYVQLESTNEADPGRWVFYVFLLTATGLMPQRSLIAVAVNPSSMAVSSDVGTHILGWLGGSEVPRTREDSIPLIDRGDITMCYDRVLEHVAQQRDQMRSRLLDRNNALIATRIAGLQRELEVRRDRFRELAERPGLNERIQRMRQSQITNLEADMRSKIESLETRREVSVRFQVVLGGVADLT